MKTVWAPMVFAAALASPAFAQEDGGEDDDARIEELEAQLNEAMRLIRSLSEEVDALKQEKAERPAPRPRAPSVADGPTQEVITELDERVTDLEDVVDGVSEQVGSRAVVNAFDAVQFDLGGFLDTAATHVIGEDGSATSFNRTVFEILARARLGKDWELFVAQAFVRNAAVDLSDRENPTFADINSPVATDTVIAQATYTYNDWVRLKAGRFITPHGIINIEHFPALLLDPEQPQFLRPFPGQTLFPNFSNGFEISGSGLFGGDNILSYHAYAATFSGNNSRFNYGGRLAYAFTDWGVTFGANVLQGERDRSVDSDYFLYGFDVLVDAGPVLWKSEFFETSEDAGIDRLAFYTQPAYRVTPKVTAFYRFDYLDAGSDPVTLQEIGISREHAFGLTFKPVSNVHLRSIVTFRSLDETPTAIEADVTQLQLSGTFNF